MTALPPVIEAEDAFLDRLAALDLSATQHVHACLMETTEPAEVAELAKAYARTSRCLRQTLGLHGHLKALRARLAREAARREVEVTAAATPPTAPTGASAGSAHATGFARDPFDIDDRGEALHDAVSRVISHAAQGDKARQTRLCYRFGRELDDWHDKPDFLDLDLDDHIAEACARLGLPADLARSWRKLPEPTFVPDEDDYDALADEDDDAPIARPPAALTASIGHDPDDDLDFTVGATPRRRSG